MVIGEVWDDPIPWQQIQRETTELSTRVERLLVEYDAACEQRVGIGRQVIEIGQIAIIGVELVELLPSWRPRGAWSKASSPQP